MAAVGVGGNGDPGYETDDPAGLALLREGGVQPDIGPFAGQRAVLEHPLTLPI